MRERRHFLGLLALGAGGALPLAGLAQTPAGNASSAFPTKVLKIVVPNGPGGAADLTARIVAQKMSLGLGQNVIVDNRPGAGGVVAAEMVAHAEPDGHTLLLVSSGTAVTAALFKKLPFDAMKDFAPVSQLASFDLVLVVAGGGRFKTLADLLAWARANPGKLNLGTPQVGTTQNLAAELFKSSAGIDAQVVPFNGTPPAITALRGGDVDAVVDILGPLIGQIGSGALLPLAALGARRALQLPAVPTVRESGGPLAGFGVSSWNGLAVPAKTPPAVIDRLNHEVQVALAQSEVKQKLLDLNLVAQGGTPAQLGALLAGDIQRWSEVIARARIPRQ
ncbi:MAG TPA: tripartite tricarboxylate transporter substrate-binding protein [Variovorax sp.]